MDPFRDAEDGAADKTERKKAATQIRIIPQKRRKKETGFCEGERGRMADFPHSPPFEQARDKAAVRSHGRLQTPEFGHAREQKPSEVISG